MGNVANSMTSGTVGLGLRAEAMKISLSGMPYSGDIQYRSHVQGSGWQGWLKKWGNFWNSWTVKTSGSFQVKLTEIWLKIIVCSIERMSKIKVGKVGLKMEQQQEQQEKV